MQKITSKLIKNYISENKIELFSTHHQLSLPIINRIYIKMVNGIKFDEIKIEENLIINGHHRYISSLLANIEINKIKSFRTSATKKFEWKNVSFVESEWDTTEKIDKMNLEDAEFNNIPLKVIIDLIKNV